MKLALMCHRHPDEAPYHVLMAVDKLDAVDYRSRCFVCFVESNDPVTECPRCGEVHRHEDAEAPA